MPEISQFITPTAFYMVHDMLDVPGGVLLSNAPVTGVEVNASTILTRLLIDWQAIGLVPVTSVRVQAIGRCGNGTVSVRVRDITAGQDTCAVDLTGASNVLAAGEWQPFELPTEARIYSVFCYGDGAADPTLHAVTWEWR